MSKENFNYDALKKKALVQFRSGKPLVWQGWSVC